MIQGAPTPFFLYQSNYLHTPLYMGSIHRHT